MTTLVRKKGPIISHLFLSGAKFLTYLHPNLILRTIFHKQAIRNLPQKFFPNALYLAPLSAKIYVDKRHNLYSFPMNKIFLYWVYRVSFVLVSKGALVALFDALGAIRQSF